MTYDFNNYQKDALTKPRDKAWENWAKFEKVGDKVQGFIRDVFFRESEGQFSDQRGLTLEQPTGELINVGIKHIDFVLSKTDGLRLNDPVTIVFEKEIPPTIKGHSPTKQFGFYGTNLPENNSQKTVAVLEAEDRKIAAAEKEQAGQDLANMPTLAEAEAAAAQNTTPGNLPFDKTAPLTAAPAGVAGGVVGAGIAGPAPTV